MAVADSFLVAELRRDQLPQLMGGDGEPLRPTSIQEIARLAPTPGELAAVWSASSAADRTPLPQLIVGDQATLDDLFAWAGAYLRGVGPLTAQTRVLTPDQLRAVLQRRQTGRWWRLAGGAVGLVIGEVLVQTRWATPPAHVSLLLCRSTLSFLLMRAAALGAASEQSDKLSELWHSLRSQSGEANQVLPRNSTLQVAQALIESSSLVESKSLELALPQRWLTAMLRAHTPAETTREVLSSFGKSIPDLRVQRMSEFTAEERVRLFDEVAPAILSGSRDRTEKAFAIALIAFSCRPGFTQQAALLKPHAAEMAEAALWLGAMQAAAPMAETLSLGDGLGWRVARDLCAPEDLFSTPRCDVAFGELRMMTRSTGSLKSIKTSARSYIEVELHPGIYALLKSGQADLPTQQDLPMPSYASPPEPRPSHDALIEVERALEAAVRSLRDARLSTPDERSGGGRRRRR